LELQLESSSELIAPTRTELDITDDSALEGVLGEFRPDTVFNCAAFHNVDACEQDEEPALAVNARAVKRLAEHCAGHGAKLIHLSTNYVFDGSQSEPYAEHDPPSPMSLYAISKLAGEYAALAYAEDALVVRTAGLYGLRGSASKGGNFVTRMVARAREQGEIRMVGDQRLSPTFTADLAEAIVDAVAGGVSGLLHLTNSGACSWYEFTGAIMEIAGIDVAIEAVETERGPGVAARPLNGVLARPGADAAGLPPLRPWDVALASYLERSGIKAPGGAAQPAP